jgi:electron transfer flavoprotein beta subunit
MHITVCIAPIIDPKLAAISLTVNDSGRGLKADAFPKQLGPFDQAALETALKLRGLNVAAEDVKISALLYAGPEDKTPAHDVMSRRIEDVVCIEPKADECWDIAAICQRFKSALTQLNGPSDLILVGREFGDCDDGVFPPLLAATLERPFVGHVHTIRRTGEDLLFSREFKNTNEDYHLATPVVVSITNYPSNRLRYPLMKDVMAAKKRNIRVISADSAEKGRAINPIKLEILSSRARDSGKHCVLAGTPKVQAKSLAEFLKSWTVAP